MRTGKKRIYIIIAVALLLFIGIGYAYLNTLLNISGSSGINKNSWDIHFENLALKEGSVIADTPATIMEDTTMIEFKVNLLAPGAFYEFNVDVVNKGSIDAMLSEVLASGITEEQKVFAEYSVIYSDGEEIKTKDSLPAGATDTIKVRVKFNDTITTEQLPKENQQLNLLFKMTYIQEDGTSTPRPQTFEKMLSGNSPLDNTASKFVTATTGINFSAPPSDTNGKGSYTLASTKDSPHPIYYYRGDVKNNNVKFAGFCWKIVRTTETGGTKLIYNGIPANDGSCTNTGTSSQIGTSAFNSPYNSPADVGYMLGTRYEKKSMNLSGKPLSGLIYGNNVSYSNGVYTLTNTITRSYENSNFADVKKKYHYTCFSSDSTTCNSVYYIVDFTAGNSVEYVTLTGGKKLDDIKRDMFTQNTTDSTIKTMIDDWYKLNMTAYTQKLEDTGWCNDRTLYSGPLKSKDEDSTVNLKTYFSGQGKINKTTYKPGVTCPTTSDKFSVNSSNGNGKLTYPVALLTADETTLAGNGNPGQSKDTYLYTGEIWWTMTPYAVGYIGATQLATEGHTFEQLASSAVRPAISLKPGTKPITGNGTANTPYVVE